MKTPVFVGVILAAATAATVALAGPGSAATTDPAAGLKLQSTSQYTDYVGVVHLLGNVVNTRATVEQPAAIIDLLDSTGTKTVSQVGQFLPVGWIEPGEEAPFDYPVPAGTTFSGKWRVDHFAGLTSQAMPSHAFALSNVTGPTSNSDSSILHGEAQNDNGYQVQLLKVEVTFFDSAGRVVYVEPTNFSDNSLIQPGATYPFSLPRISGTPTFDVNNHAIIVEANEPGTPQAPPTTGAAMPLNGPFRAFPAIPRYSGSLNEHAPVTDTKVAGNIPSPTASDLAGFARPGTVVRQHDTAPVDTGSVGSQRLVNVSASAPSSGTARAWAPVVLIVLLGGYGLLAALGSARSGLAGLKERRAGKRETLSALAPGATGGYGAMPGAQR